MNRVPITKEGFELLKKDLQKLIKQERPRVIKSIEEALSHGDLSENAEYSSAKERQSFIETRIMELEGQIASSQIETIKGPYSRGVFGATITIENIDTGEQKAYTLVGPYESAPEKGRLSIATPMGKALLTREVGDEIRVKVPKGYQDYAIIDIE